jgi:predicted PurR-regulated permease PerM
VEHPLTSYRSLSRVALAVATCAVIYKLTPLFLFLAISVLIGVLLHQIVDILKTRFLFPVWAANGVVVLAALGTVSAIFFFLIPSLVNQVVALARHLPELRHGLEASIASDELRKLVHDNIEKLPDELGSLPAEAAQIGSTALHGLYQFLLLVILSLYFMLDGDRAYQAILGQVEKHHSVDTRERIVRSALEVRAVIFAYAFGQLITCAFVAVFAYAVARLLHVPGALTLAALATLCDLLPAVGFIISLTAGVTVALTVSSGTALALAALYLLYSLIENYLLIPRIYGTTMKLSRLVVLLGILIGGELAGILGMLLVLPILGSLRVIEKHWIDARRTVIEPSTKRDS